RDARASSPERRTDVPDPLAGKFLPDFRYGGDDVEALAPAERDRLTWTFTRRLKVDQKRRIARGSQKPSAFDHGKPVRSDAREQKHHAAMPRPPREPPANHGS